MNNTLKRLLLIFIVLLVAVLILAIADWIKLSKGSAATVEVRKVVVEK